jgi:uncharacterized protein YbcC (UPF0753/DUF2309 family)
MKNLAKEISLKDIIWQKISPTWPLRNIIACNPLQGFEKYNFTVALELGLRFFQNRQIPAELEKINYITIKWCQVFFDEGQATISMPNRQKGFYQSWRELAIFDDHLHKNLQNNIEFIKQLPKSSGEAIDFVLEKMNILQKDQENFLLLMLTTLAGWSSYVKYLGKWSYQRNDEIENDYLAIRLIITAIIWPNATKELLKYINNIDNSSLLQENISQITIAEKKYYSRLLTQINQGKKHLSIKSDIVKKFDAQFVFCIDVRSEQMRRSLEMCGNYQTFGFAGFFGIPMAIYDDLTKDSYSSCPVLLTPKYDIIKNSSNSIDDRSRKVKGYTTISEIKKFYQSLKYNFTTPLPLAEGMGIWSGGWMLIKTFSPKGKKLMQKGFGKILGQNFDYSLTIDNVPFIDQCAYAIGFLRNIGLVKNFAEIVILCGHGSKTENNTYATALDCGACGGRHGDSNAKILAKILNQEAIRDYLKKEGIVVPTNTSFIAAKHNTTTDEIDIYPEDCCKLKELDWLKFDINKARNINNSYRAKTMGVTKNSKKLYNFFLNRSNDWSETQAEWGLAKNASFIIAPRSLTKNIDLGGRAFLHSYNWEIDENGAILSLIINAPMIVAQWINSQYLFSTIDNVAFGAGSKITQNIVGKIGVMQGNASDLMHGLPLQSVYVDDKKQYHEPIRLMVVIYAPSSKIDKVIFDSKKVQELIVNEWIKIYCLNPEDEMLYELQKSLIWSCCVIR